MFPFQSVFQIKRLGIYNYLNTTLLSTNVFFLYFSYFFWNKKITLKILTPSNYFISVKSNSERNDRNPKWHITSSYSTSNQSKTDWRHCFLWLWFRSSCVSSLFSIMENIFNDSYKVQATRSISFRTLLMVATYMVQNVGSQWSTCWRDSSGVKRTCYFCRRPKLGSQHPHLIHNHQWTTPYPQDPTPSSGWGGHLYSHTYTHTQTYTHS